MDIFYTKRTLYVNFLDLVNRDNIKTLENRVFKILDSYDIDNIVVKIISDDNYDDDLFNEFISNYKLNYKGNLRID